MTSGDSTKGRFAEAVRDFGANRAGVTAIEYALIAAVMGAALIASMTIFGGALESLVTSIGGHMGIS